MKESIKTFKELYDYIQTAERDETGMHQTISGIKLHIYDTRREMNVYPIEKISNHKGVPIGKVIFENDCILLYNIDRGGCTDYDNPITCNYNSPIIKSCLSDDDDSIRSWYGYPFLGTACMC